MGHQAKEEEQTKESCQLHAPAALYTGKVPHVPKGQDTGWALQPICAQRKVKRYLALMVTETTLLGLARSIVTMVTEL
jgi:hypothetical protein